MHELLAFSLYGISSTLKIVLLHLLIHDLAVSHASRHQCLPKQEILRWKTGASSGSKRASAPTLQAAVRHVRHLQCCGRGEHERHNKTKRARGDVRHSTHSPIRQGQSRSGPASLSSELRTNPSCQASISPTRLPSSHPTVDSSRSIRFSKDLLLSQIVTHDAYRSLKKT